MNPLASTQTMNIIYKINRPWIHGMRWNNTPHFFLSLIRFAGPENSGLVRFVTCPAVDGSRQNELRPWFEIRSPQHRLNFNNQSKPIPLFGGLTCSSFYTPG